MSAPEAALELLPGETVRIGRRDYVLPALNLKGIRRAMELAPTLEGDGVDSMMACLEVVHLALKRNYPELTIEQLEEEVDAASLATLSVAVLSMVGGSLPLPAATPGAGPAPPLELATE